MASIFDTLAPIGMGIVTGAIGDNRQRRQQQALMNMQVEAQKRLTNFNREQQLQMWHDTNFGPQVEELKKAGLNPGLIYGMHGAGGTTAAISPGSVTGTQAATPSGKEMQEFLGLGLQREMLQAQKQLIQAQAQNVQADTQLKTGVQTEEAQTRIASLTQGINNQKAQEHFTKVETMLKELQLEIGKYTKEDAEDYIGFMTDKIKYEVGEAERQAFISRATMNTKVDIIKTQLASALLQNELTKIQTTKTGQDIKMSQAEIQNMANQLLVEWQKIKQNWTNLSLEERNTKTKEMEIELKKKYPGLWNVAGGTASGIVDTILGWFDKLEKTITK